MFLKTPYKIVVEAIKEFSGDGATGLGAALSFYTALSLAPMQVILMFVAGVIGQGAQTQLIQEIVSLVGPQAGFVIELIIENARQQQDTGLFSAVLGIAAVVLSATLVFAQLQTSMNRIWDVEVKPKIGAFLLSWLRKRALSLSLMAGIGFLLLVSLAISAALGLIFSSEDLLWKYADLGVSLLIYTLLFAMIFKVLPDVHIAWRDMWLGAFVTAILFDVGKYAIGKYLGYSSVGSTYGAAGSLVVLLLWVYYSSLIMFFGAELVHVISRRRSVHCEPEEFAVEGNPNKGPQDLEITAPDMGTIAPPKGDEKL